MISLSAILSSPHDTTMVARSFNLVSSLWVRHDVYSALAYQHRSQSYASRAAKKYKAFRAYSNMTTTVTLLFETAVTKIMLECSSECWKPILPLELRQNPTKIAFSYYLHCLDVLYWLLGPFLLVLDVQEWTTYSHWPWDLSLKRLNSIAGATYLES